MRITSSIVKAGSGIALYIPKEIVLQMQLKAGDRMKLDIRKNGSVLVAGKKDKKTDTPTISNEYPYV